MGVGRSFDLLIACHLLTLCGYLAGLFLKDTTGLSVFFMEWNFFFSYFFGALDAETTAVPPRVQVRGRTFVWSECVSKRQARVCFKETRPSVSQVGQRFESLSTRARDHALRRRPGDHRPGRAPAWQGASTAADWMGSPQSQAAAAPEHWNEKLIGRRPAIPPARHGPPAFPLPPLRRCRLGRSRRLTRSRAGRLSRSQAE